MVAHMSAISHHSAPHSRTHPSATERTSRATACSQLLYHSYSALRWVVVIFSSFRTDSGFFETLAVAYNPVNSDY